MATETGFPGTDAPLIRDNGRINIPWYQFLIGLWRRTGGADGIDAIGIPGEIRIFGGPNLPATWLACDGAAVSRTTYKTLFSAIGTYWGLGDTVTTFNVPPLNNRFIIGVGSLYGLGQLGGADAANLLSGAVTAFRTPPKYAGVNFMIKT